MYEVVSEQLDLSECPCCWTRGERCFKLSWLGLFLSLG